MRLAVLFLTVLSVCGAQEAKPSRAPYAGCTWKPLQDTQLGIELLIQNCEGNRARQFLAVQNILRGVRPGANPETGDKLVLVLEKPARQSIDEAIQRRFYPSLTSRQKAGCQIMNVSEQFNLGEGKEVFQIKPTSVYKAEADKMREDDAGAEVCGAFGELNSVQYFEFHPGENRGKYLFVRLGLDPPLFDEKSIRVLSK